MLLTKQDLPEHVLLLMLLMKQDLTGTCTLSYVINETRSTRNMYSYLWLTHLVVLSSVSPSTCLINFVVLEVLPVLTLW